MNDAIGTRLVPVDLHEDEDGFRSVQSLAIRAQEPMREAMDLYFSWLGGMYKGLVTVTGDTATDGVVFNLAGVAAIRLKLRERSGPRITYDISGGALARPGGSFAFARVSDGQAVAALLGFRPRLPGWLYRWTHGRVHVSVMNKFARMLEARS